MGFVTHYVTDFATHFVTDFATHYVTDFAPDSSLAVSKPSSQE